MKVLLVGHACSPRRGSELAFTWNWAWHLSQIHQVWVLTHPQEREYIEAYLSEHPNPNLRFVWVNVHHRLDTWDPRRDNHVSPLHYVLWQRAALADAMLLHKQVCFDLSHHVSWGTVSEPPLLWRLPIPFVWGPVGGGQVSPTSFRRYMGPAARGEMMRNIRLRLIAFRPNLRKASRKSAMVFATNYETAGILRKAGASRLKLFLDTGLRDEFLPEHLPQRAAGKQITLLWVGRLLPRKCLSLAIEALSKVDDISVRLIVAGEGAMRREYEAMTERLGLINCVEFLGEVPYTKMPGLYRSADAFIFTSLRDSFGSQVLEAMASGLPVISLDHQGVGAFMPQEAGVKVPVTNPEETVTALATAIRHVARSPQARNEMGKVAWEFARTHTWKHRAEQMSRCYEVAVNWHRNMLCADSESGQEKACASGLSSATTGNRKVNPYEISYKS